MVNFTPSSSFLMTIREPTGGKDEGGEEKGDIWIKSVRAINAVLLA